MISIKNFEDKSSIMNKMLDDSKIKIIKDKSINNLKIALSIINNKSFNESLSTNTSYYNSTVIKIKENHKIFGNEIDIKNPIKMGNTKNFFYIKEFPIISIGPHYFYSFFLLLFMTLIYILFLIFFCKKSGNVLNFLYQISFIFYFISHFLSIFMNPGIPSYKYIKKNNDIFINKNNTEKIKFSICKKCNCIVKVKDKVHHCSICNICYINYEFHSKWIGHCVAKNNKIFFHIFEISFGLFVLVCFSILFVNFLKLLLNI